MRLFIRRRNILILLLSVILFFSTVAIAQVKTEILPRQTVSVGTTASLLRLSLVKTQQVAEINEIDTERVNRIIILEKEKEFWDRMLRIHRMIFLAAIWCGSLYFFVERGRILYEKCEKKKNLIICYIHQQDGEKCRVRKYECLKI